MECPYLLLDRFWGPQDGFFGFSSGGYLEGGERVVQRPFAFEDILVSANIALATIVLATIALIVSFPNKLQDLSYLDDQGFKKHMQMEFPWRICNLFHGGK